MNRREQKQKKENPICDGCGLGIKGSVIHHRHMCFCSNECREDYEYRQQQTKRVSG